jgi:hypothetical protein
VTPLPYQLLIWLVGVIFGAGGAWAMLRQVRKDLNGVGGRQRRFERNMTLAMLAILQDRRDRELLAQFLKE